MNSDSLDEAPDQRRGLTKESLAVLGVAVLLLCSLAVPQFFRYLAGTLPSTEPDVGAPARPSPAGEFRGMCIQIQSNDPDIPYEQYIDEIAKIGANTVCISLAALQENCAASTIFMEYRRIPPMDRLEKIIKQAHASGMRVILMPIVLLSNPGAGEWRGKIAPKDSDAWWESYDDYVLYYAKLAQKTDVEVFMVGSELVSMEDQTDRWRKLIAKVRQAYSGRMSYSANWDHYEKIEFWRDLDLVGMTSYYDLVGDKKPTLEVLLDSWKPIKKDILAWQKKVGRSIIFTEAGWPSQEGCAKEPWNYYASTKPDPTTQDLCFQAFFQTWKDEKIVAGVLVWEWRNGPWQKCDMEDIGYCPLGKPALKTIREFYQLPGPNGPTSRPGPPTTTSKPASKPAAKPGGKPATASGKGPSSH